jgi:hypothetical protein
MRNGMLSMCADDVGDTAAAQSVLLPAADAERDQPVRSTVGITALSDGVMNDLAPRPERAPMISQFGWQAEKGVLPVGQRRVRADRVGRAGWRLEHDLKIRA